jgi:ADP-ribose pyrophosphatase
MNHQITAREVVYKGNAFRVQKLNVRMPDNRVRVYDLVVHNDSVTIVPLDEKGNIWFVTQFRMGSEEILLELPAGVLEDGETPENCASREIREEIGMAAGKLHKLGAIYLAPGYSNELNHIYLATDLSPSPLEADEDEFLEIEKYPFISINSMVASGEINDSKSVAALSLTSIFLNK